MIDAFLKLLDDQGTQVAGEALDKEYTTWIALLSFRMGDKAAAVYRGSSADATAEAIVSASSSAGSPLEKLHDFHERIAQAGRAVAELSALPQGAKDQAIRIAGWAGESQRLTDELKNLFNMTSTTARQFQEQQEPPPPEQPATEGTSEGKAAPNELCFSIDKYIDEASPELFQANCVAKAHKPPKAQHTGLARFKQAVVHVRRLANGRADKYLICSFDGVELEDYAIRYDSTREHLVEAVTFKFKTYAMTYAPHPVAGVKVPVARVSGSIAALDQK